MEKNSTPSEERPGRNPGKSPKRKKASRFEPMHKVPTAISLDLSLLEYVGSLDTAAYRWYNARGAFTGAEVNNWRRFFVSHLVRMEQKWPASFKEWSRRNRVILPFGTLDLAASAIKEMIKMTDVSGGKGDLPV
jgi:hypothetical protein